MAQKSDLFVNATWFSDAMTFRHFQRDFSVQW